MTVLDVKFVPKATALLNKYGKDATYTVIQRPDYNPATGATARKSPQTGTFKIVPPEFMEGYIGNEGVKAGQAKTWMAAENLTFSPKTPFDMRYDGKNFKVVELGTIFSGELVTLYQLTYER